MAVLGTVVANLLDGDPAQLTLTCAGHVSPGWWTNYRLTGGENSRGKGLLFFLIL